MQRVAAIIALIFAFASLAGTTMAHAHRYQSLPMDSLIVLNHVDADNVSIPVFVKVQRGEIDLGSGIMLPCGPYHAIPVSLPIMPAPPECGLAFTTLAASAPRWIEQIPLRPPKTA